MKPTLKYISLLIAIGVISGASLAQASIFDWFSSLVNPTPAETLILGAPTQTFQTNLFPLSTNTYLLGSSTRQWLNFYTQNASSTNLTATNFWSTNGTITNATTTTFRSSGLATFGGNVGIGTTTPSFLLSVGNFFGIDSVGHIVSIGTAPTVTLCGTSPAIVGTDLKGTVTEGTIATGCTVTFANTYTTAPTCVLSSESALAFSYSTTATAITMVNIGTLSSTKVDYICVK